MSTSKGPLFIDGGLPAGNVCCTLSSEQKMPGCGTTGVDTLMSHPRALLPCETHEIPVWWLLAAAQEAGTLITSQEGGPQTSEAVTGLR